MISFTELIDKAIEKENAKEHISSGKFSPSLFGYCYRRQIWKRKGEPETNKPDKRTLRVFKVGKLFEQWVCDLLKDVEGIQFQVLVEEEDIKGYADVVLEDVVPDIKTMHSQGFHYLRKKDCDIKKEKYNNWLQDLYYADRLNKKFGKLVFLSKDDLCVEEPTQAVNEYWKGELKKEIDILRGFWKANVLPAPEPRLFISKATPCKECEKYCSYLNKCYKLQGKELPKTKEE